MELVLNDKHSSIEYYYGIYIVEAGFVAVSWILVKENLFWLLYLTIVRIIEEKTIWELDLLSLETFG